MGTLSTLGSPLLNPTTLSLLPVPQYTPPSPMIILMGILLLTTFQPLYYLPIHLRHVTLSPPSSLLVLPTSTLHILPLLIHTMAPSSNIGFALYFWRKISLNFALITHITYIALSYILNTHFWQSLWQWAMRAGCRRRAVGWWRGTMGNQGPAVFPFK